MSMDDILRVLAISENVKNVTMIDVDEYGFSRRVRFEIEGQIYVIERWANTCYLEVGNAKINFDKVRFEGTWPNCYKNNLQFYDDRNEVFCVIGVDKYPNETEVPA